MGKTPRYGRPRERRWTETCERGKAQDTIVIPIKLETDPVRKLWEIGHLRTLSPCSNGWMKSNYTYCIVFNYLYMYSAPQQPWANRGALVRLDPRKKTSFKKLQGSRKIG